MVYVYAPVMRWMRRKLDVCQASELEARRAIFSERWRIAVSLASSMGHHGVRHAYTVELALWKIFCMCLSSLDIGA
jgi:hypothetical protein